MEWNTVTGGKQGREKQVAIFKRHHTTLAAGSVAGIDPRQSFSSANTIL